MKRPFVLLACAVVLMLALAPATFAESTAGEAGTQLLCVDPSVLVPAVAGEPALGIIEAALPPICSHNICYDGSPVLNCRCPSGSCRPGKLSWCDSTWHPTCYCY